jgi:hypothetical protein
MYVLAGKLRIGKGEKNFIMEIVGDMHMEFQFENT